MSDAPQIGRCYCGACSILSAAPALTVAYCHCADCKRWTGAPAPAFAAFAAHSVEISPPPATVTHDSGVTRQNCPQCGSPLSATFPYLAQQVYVPLGVLDDPDAYPPRVHCYADQQIQWQRFDDGLPTANTSARDVLKGPDHG